MKKRTVLLLIISLVVGLAAGCDLTLGAGELPIWSVGDSWWFINVANDTAYDFVETVVDEATIDGTDCYELAVFWLPDTPLNGTGLHNDMKMWIDKTSFLTAKINATGEASGYPFIYNTTYSYEIEMVNGSAPWPRVVGHEWKLNTTTRDTVWIQISPNPPTWVPYVDDTYWNVTWIKVEAFENVTVSAGTFECFRIATYNETGDGLLFEEWHSDDLRISVKTINYNTPGYTSGEHGPDTMEFVRIRIPGDTDGNGIVNILDVLAVAVAFGTEPGDLKWDPRADLDFNKIINILDILIIAVHFGETSS